MSLGLVTDEYDKTFHKPENLLKYINSTDVVLFQGGGNFGDLYRLLQNIRNSIVSNFKENLVIFMPLTINYRNKKNIAADQKVFQKRRNVVLSVRSFESYKFARKHFSTNRIVPVPDLAFMIDDFPPFNVSTYDIVVLKRKDKESKFPKGEWETAYEMLSDKYSYIEKDWYDFIDFKWDLSILGQKRTELGNMILSKGKIIITDRLHASILSLLMGKPHIMIDEKYDKIRNTRELAFYGKDECQPKYTGGVYAKNPIDAIKKAVRYFEKHKNT